MQLLKMPGSLWPKSLTSINFIIDLIEKIKLRFTLDLYPIRNGVISSELSWFLMKGNKDKEEYE
jgi:hypothetical protein